MNVEGLGDRCDEFLEWCRSEGVGAAFAGEAAAYRGGGMTTMDGYNIVSRWGKGQRVVVYMAAEWEEQVGLTYQQERLVILQVGDKSVARVYSDSRTGRKEY